MAAKQSLVLEATSRDVVGKAVRVMRGQGTIPAVLYGHGEKPQSISLSTSVFDKIFKEAGESTIIGLKVDNGAPINVIIQDVQNHGTTSEPMHVDFYQVRMDEKLTATVPIEFSGESHAVKVMSGTLVHNMSEVEVESLPGDLPSEIIVDVSVLKNLDDVIRVKDLDVDRSKVEIQVEDEEQIVASIEPPRSEDELAELEAAPTDVDVTEVEGVEKKEGEAPTPEGEDTKE